MSSAPVLLWPGQLVTPRTYGAPAMSVLRGIVCALAVLLACGVSGAATPSVALLTILDGEATVLRDSHKLALGEGVALQADDIVELGPQARLLRLEFPDGLSLDLGPGGRALLAPKLAGERARARLYLLTGWAKLSAPKGVAAALLSPALDLDTRGGTVVLALTPQGSQVFAEDGELQLRRPGAAAQTLKSGELLSLPADGAKPVLSAGPPPSFGQAMPRAFMDSLPMRAALFQGKEVAPKRIGAIAYADAQPWIDAEPALRRAYLPRWRGLARDAEFRRGLVAGLKAHPEWQPVLFPPPPPSQPARATAKPAATY